MPHWVILLMIYLGAALMVYNIYGFICYARYVRSQEDWGRESNILYFPIILLILFLLGYLAVALFGKPDMIMALILFGGSIFVFIIYHFLNIVTHRIIESERLEIELRAAEETNRIKDSFLASISHEMRTPMNVILGVNNLVMNDPAVPAETRTQLKKIEHSGRHLLELINDILELQNIQDEAAEPKHEPFSLRNITDQVSAIAGTRCHEKGLNYHLNVQEAAYGYYCGDQKLIKKVVLSLLDNAIKYTDVPGDVRFSVRMENPDEPVLRFIVEDTGIGMNPDFLPKAFEFFTQEDQSFASRFGGSGMGLALTRQKVEFMGGVITATSQQGIGSVFTVTLPLERCEDEKSEVMEDKTVLEGSRVLIVEDIPENAEIVADLLELEDMLSEHAENGKVAVEMFEQSQPGYYDVILMDLRMPVMDGLEAARIIRALERPDAKSIPILALTANTAASDVEHTFAAGMNAHLTKPIDVDVLYSTLKKWIGLTRKGGNKS